MPARPEARLGVGVKTAVRMKSVPLIGPSVPPVRLMSLASKLLPGSSLKLKVRVAVSPDFSVAWLLVMASVGATVSTGIESVPAATPALPAASA